MSNSFCHSITTTLVAGALALAAPLSAQEDSEAQPLPDFENMTLEEAFSAFEAERGRWARESCSFGVPVLGVILKYQPENESAEYLHLLSQAYCADDEKRYEDGAALASQLNARDPENPETGLTLYFGMRTDDPDYVLDHLATLSGENFSELKQPHFWPAIRTIRKAGREDEFEDLALTWFEQNQAGFINGDLLSALSMQALGSAARQDRANMVGQLLSYITNPSVYVDLLTDRKYEVFWPQIEARTGTNLSAIGEAHIDMTANRLTLAPNDRDRFSAAARALQYHGDFEEVITLAETWKTREERGLEFEEGDAWALNLQAYAYDSLGQLERADAVFEQLAQIDPEENNWIVSFVINRASRLVGFGRWEEGLAAAQYARTVRGSPYAEMIVAKDHTCALTQLGRDEEAEAELEFIRANVIESAHLAAQALMCRGYREEAAQILIEALADPAKRSSAIAALSADANDLFYTQSMLPKPRELMAEYPELAALYQEHARDLPDNLIPRAATLRVKLDLPEWE